MKLVSFAVIVAFASSAACERDPASNVKIIARPTATATQPLPTTYPPTPPFRSELCKVPPEATKGTHRFVVEGPCAFVQTSNMACKGSLDDLYASLLRAGPGEVTVSVYLNIETVAAPAPGKFSGAQMFLTVQNGNDYYYWSSDSVTATIGPGMRTVTIPRTRLDAEPPNTGTEIVSGTFACNPDAKLDTTRVAH